MDEKHLDQERLGQALVGRGFMTRDEFQRVRSSRMFADLADLLRGLVEAGRLTRGQGEWAARELANLLVQQIPGYQILEKLGQGAMGIVFKAKQLSMDRFVAIKVLHPRWANRPEYLRRFHREAHLAARFSSPNIVQAIDVGNAGDLHYFVMEYVEGVTIKQALDRGEIFPPDEALAILTQIAKALEQAHRQGLIHRDIKPANIMLTVDGVAKLADLGVARESTDFEQAESEKGKTIGTPYYIAPEQIRVQGDIDIRADIYSLGATWHHMLTGRPPFAYAVNEQILHGHLHEPLVPAHLLNSTVPPAFSNVLQVMMAKDLAARYPTPTELLVDLESLKAGQEPALFTAVPEIDLGGAVDSIARKPVPLIWFVAVIALLIFSLALNLILGLRD